MAARERERVRCRERLEALAGAELGAEEVRREAIAAMSRAVGFERWCWPLTDPASVLSVSGIGEIDIWPSLARLVALEHAGDITSKPRLVTGGRPSVTLSAATRGDLARSTRWRECLSPYGIGDELMTACRDGQGCWGSVELVRASSDSPFDEQDQQFLDDLAPILGTLIRRSVAQSWRYAPVGVSVRMPGTLILDRDLQPMSWTPPFTDWLSELPAPGPDFANLPPAVYEIAARVQAAQDVCDALPDRVRIRAATGRWSVIEGSRLEGAQDGGVAITVRAAVADEISDLLCRGYGLTRRERQLVAHMLEGLATKDVAAAMHISPYTVQDHLKAIFAKTRLRSRRELVSHLSGDVGRTAVADARVGDAGGSDIRRMHDRRGAFEAQV